MHFHDSRGRENIEKNFAQTFLRGYFGVQVTNLTSIFKNSVVYGRLQEAR